jgi:hypothetical protein
MQANPSDFNKNTRATYAFEFIKGV